MSNLGLLKWLRGEESTGNARDISVPGSERSSGEGNVTPLQYSCLENPIDRGAWWATVHGVTKNQHDWMTKQQRQQFRINFKIIRTWFQKQQTKSKSFHFTTWSNLFKTSSIPWLTKSKIYETSKQLFYEIESNLPVTVHFSMRGLSKDSTWYSTNH